MGSRVLAGAVRFNIWRHCTVGFYAQDNRGPCIVGSHVLGGGLTVVSHVRGGGACTVRSNAS